MFFFLAEAAKRIDKARELTPRRLRITDTGLKDCVHRALDWVDQIIPDRFLLNIELAQPPCSHQMSMDERRRASIATSKLALGDPFLNSLKQTWIVIGRDLRDRLHTRTLASQLASHQNTTLETAASTDDGGNDAHTVSST